MTSLDELHRQYHDSLASKREDLRKAWDPLCDEAATAAQVAHLHLLLHRLAGSAGTYGYPELAQRAKMQELAWTEWLAQAQELRPAPYLVCAKHAGGMLDLLDALQAARKS